MSEIKSRKAWMGIMAKTAASRVEEIWNSANYAPEYTYLRPSEIGGVMVQGRTGGTGSAFNIGEMTVTRCSVQLSDGTVGHGYVQGRSKRHAEISALVDALMQTKISNEVRTLIIEPLNQEIEAAHASKRAKAAATKVEFFTMTRGED